MEVLTIFSKIRPNQSTASLNKILTGFSFVLGQGRVIKGWDEGIAQLKVGSKAWLMIPPDLGYGSRGAGGGAIPPNSMLFFYVEVVEAAE